MLLIIIVNVFDGSFYMTLSSKLIDLCKFRTILSRWTCVDTWISS